MKNTLGFLPFAALLIGGLLFAGLLFAGCGSPLPSGSCLLADHSRCTDYAERQDYLDGDQDECVLQGNAWSDGSCNTTGFVGACHFMSGDSTNTVWYLDHSRTTSEIESTCVVTNGTFTAP